MESILKTRLAARSVVIATLPGCFYNKPSYPEQWAKPAIERGCPELDGWYKDKGSTYMGVRYKPSIYMILLGGLITEMDEAEFVEIASSDDEISIRAYNENKSLIEERSFHSGNNKCSDGFLKLDVPETEDFESREGAVAYTWEGHRLTKAKDGALILEIDSGGVAFVLAIPAVDQNRIWARFERVNPP